MLGVFLLQPCSPSNWALQGWHFCKRLVCKCIHLCLNLCSHIFFFFMGLGSHLSCVRVLCAVAFEILITFAVLSPFSNSFGESFRNLVITVYQGHSGKKIDEEIFVCLTVLRLKFLCRDKSKCFTPELYGCYHFFFCIQVLQVHFYQILHKITAQSILLKPV